MPHDGRHGIRFYCVMKLDALRQCISQFPYLPSHHGGVVDVERASPGAFGELRDWKSSDVEYVVMNVEPRVRFVLRECVDGHSALSFSNRSASSTASLGRSYLPLGLRGK